MRSLFFIVFLSVLLTSLIGCAAPSGQAVNGIKYVKDPRTNFCFAILYTDSLTQVSCSEIPSSVLQILNVSK